MANLTGAETLAAEEFLYATLQDATCLAGAPGGVHRNSVPDGAPRAAAWVFHNQNGPLPGQEVAVLGGPGILAVLEYAVKLVIPGETVGPLEEAALRRCYELLSLGAGTTAAGSVRSRRIGPVSYPEEDGDRKYLHVGGMYALTVTGG